MKKSHISRAKLFLGAGLLFSGLFFLQGGIAFAAEVAAPVTVNTVDYEEEEIVLNNNGNTKIYFATEIDAAKEIWEVMPADDGATTRLDFSWVSASMENILKIKGGDDPSASQVRIVLPQRTTKLDITINYANINSLPKNAPIASLLNIMTTAGTGANPITFDDLEWKKGEGGKWKDIDLLTVAQLEKYQIKGTDLYFRISAVNDETWVDAGGVTHYPDGYYGRRSSAEVKVKIARKATAIVVGIDGIRFTADIRYGKEYRVQIGANKTDWIKVTDRTVKKLSLTDIAKSLGYEYDGITDPFPAMFLEIRDYATSKTAASKITEIDLGEQTDLSTVSDIVRGKAPANAPATNTDIYVSYSGNKTLVVAIPSASVKNPFEYTVVKPGEDFDVTKAVWSSITKGTDVKILGSKAVDGGRLYIRQKEIKSKEATKTVDAVGYKLASTVLTYDIKYPSIPVVEKDSFTYVKVLSLASNQVEFDVKLNSVGRDAYETKINTIKLGTRTIDFEQEILPAITEENPFDTDVEYTLRVKLKQESLETMPSSASRALAITFANGSVDKTSVKLTIKNPTLAAALTVTPLKGSAAGMTKVNIVSSTGAGNAYAYLITSASMEGRVYTDDFISNHAGATSYTPGADIAVTEGSYLTIIEYNTTAGHFVKYKSIPVTIDIIG